MKLLRRFLQKNVLLGQQQQSTKEAAKLGDSANRS